jgi:hypothetical protein
MRRWGHASRASIRHGSRATLLLASAMTLLAAANLALPVEPLVMSWVYAFEARAPQWLGGSYASHQMPKVTADRFVTLLELGPTAFEKDFQRRSPLERGCIAETLERLAVRLAERQPPGGFPVVAIDIDVTLDGGEPRAPQASASAASGGARAKNSDPDAVTCIDDPDRIRGALETLTEHATVIALALERRTPAQRKARNEFVKATCSESFRPGGLVDPNTRSTKTKDGGVYFASAAAFSRGTRPIYETPTNRRPLSGKSKAEDLGLVLPGHYPSLGNMLAIARRAHDSGIAGKDAVETLTSLCTSVHEQAKRKKMIDVVLMDDLVLASVGDITVDEVALHYDFGLINFLAADVQVREVKLERLAHISRQPVLSSTIVLALTDGSTGDRFITPNNAEDFTPGAWLHAANAISLGGGLTKADMLVKLVADLAAGLLFSALAASVLHLRSTPWPTRPLIHRALQLGLPVVIAGVVVSLGFCLSARLLSLGVWFNPLYMAIGMALHAYVDASVPSHSASAIDRESHQPEPAAIVTLDGVASEESVWEEMASPLAGRTMLHRTTRHLQRIVAWIPGVHRRKRSRPQRPITSRLSDWVDVDPPAPPTRRAGVDSLARRAWALGYYSIVTFALGWALVDLALQLLS